METKDNKKKKKQVNDKKPVKANIKSTKLKAEKVEKTKKKRIDFNKICLILFAICTVFVFYNVFQYFETGEITAKLYLVDKYYTGAEFAASLDIKDNKTGLPLEATVEAQLYDRNGKKVKNGNTEVESNSFEDLNITLPISEDLKEGSYEIEFKIKSKEGRAKIKRDIYISNKVNENINVSFDKGIYKPGDEVNFRTLILSANDDTPKQEEIEISIFDGNDNRVYIEKVKTSEFGIASTKFKLANEVNSGTYKVKILSNEKEYIKTFKVDAYITPQFSVNINSDKSECFVGEKVKFDIEAKYFFGEPVKDAEIIISMDQKEETLKTYSDGKVSYEIEFKNKGSFEMKVKAVDTSNYYAEASKNIIVAEKLFNIDVLPEYGKIVKNTNNKIYIYTKTNQGQPIATNATITLGKIVKNVFTSDDGVGYIYLSKEEIEKISGIVEVTAKRVDTGEEVTYKKNLGITTEYNVVSTDKVKYENNEDIKITIGNPKTSNKSIAIVKGGELIKLINTSENVVEVNLDGQYGLIDIYCESTVKTGSNDYKIATANKKTIFIKPNKELNLTVKTDKEQYEPGEKLNISFTAKDIQNAGVDTALLVSIIDEANLNVAENDLNIDNIKLALEGIKLADGLDAATLYACILEENSDDILTGLLLKQEPTEFGGRTYTQSSYAEKQEYQAKIFLGGSILILIGTIYLARLVYSKLKQKTNLVIEIVNFLTTWIVLTAILGEVIYDIVYNETVVFIATAIMTIIIDILIFREIKAKVCKFYLDITFALLAIVTMLMIYELSSSLAVILALIIILIYVILKKSNAKGRYEGICNTIGRILKNSIIILLSYNTIIRLDSVFLGIVTLLLCYIVCALYNKLKISEKIKSEFEKSFSSEYGKGENANLNNYKENYNDAREREKKVKQKIESEENKKIVINIKFAQVAGVIILIIFVLAILLLASIGGLTQSFSGNISNDTGYGSFDSVLDGIILPNASVQESITQSSDNKGDLSLNDMFNYSDKFTSSESTGTNDKNDSAEQNKDEKITEVEENIRNVFLESLAFIPELVIEKGEGSKEIELSDNITTWCVQIVGNTKNGDVGYATSNFRVFKDFFVDFSLPMNSKVGDKVSLPITVYNYTDKELVANYKIEKQDWFNTTSGLEGNVKVEPKGTKLVYFEIEIIKDGTNKFRVETTSGEYSDIVEKSMEVTLKGVEINEIKSNGYVSDKTEQDVIFMDDYIEGSNKIAVKLYPNMMSLNIEGIESIFELPTGCFEQVSSSLYPNILALKYLKSKDDVDQALLEKVNHYLNVGYQKLLTYEVKTNKGGFSLYGNSPAETVLTAYGLMEFNELSEVYDVDENVIRRMEKFLEDKQNMNGSFKLTGYNNGGALRTDDYSLNAYVTWAISESNISKSILNKAVEYLEKNIEHYKDPYSLGLVANVFVNTDNKNADAIIDRLVENLENKDVRPYLKSNIYDYYGTYGRYQNLQSTALLSIALSNSNKYAETNQKLVEYILSEKRANGTWGTTQATILALKALNTFEESNKVSNQTIKVSVGSDVREIKVAQNAYDFYVEYFENVEKQNKVKIDGVKENIYYEILGNYYVDYEKVEENNSFEISVEMQNDLKVNQEVNQKIKIKNNTSDGTQNAMVVVSIPQGFTVNTNSLDLLKGKQIIEKYENNYGKINIYLRDFAKAEEVELNISYRTMYPIECLGGDVRVFDYYNPNVETIFKPMEFRVK